MDTNKILKVLGLFFVVLGAVIGIGLILSGFAAKSIPLAFMGIVFVMMFCGIGGFFAWIGNGDALRHGNARTHAKACVDRFEGLRVSKRIATDISA